MKAYRTVKIYHFEDGTKLLEEAGALPPPSSRDALERIGKEVSILDVSFDHYQDHESWVTIAYANGIIDPWENLINTVLVIPHMQ
jgi:hypothetical protein